MSTISIRQPDRINASASTAKLLSAAPLHELLSKLRADHAVMARLTPNADAVATLGVIVSDLASAIARAADVNVFMTIEEVSRMTGRPESTLTRLCRDHGAKIGAAKIAGAWSIHWPTFEKFFSGRNKETFIEEAA
jgi:hypothetical protein